MLGWARSRTKTGFSIGAAVAGAATALLLAGCSSGPFIADHLPNAVGGLPEGVPERPATEQAYPAVHNMPPQRATTTLTDAQQKLLQDDLAAVRDRYGVPPDASSATGTTRNSSAGAAKKP
jgi:hypothetical protein